MQKVAKASSIKGLALNGKTARALDRDIVLNSVTPQELY